MRYKVIVKNIPHTDYKIQKPFLGVSISNPIYLEELKVSKIIQWISHQFNSDKIILIGDVLHTYNLNMFKEYVSMNLEQEKQRGELIKHNFVQSIESDNSYKILDWSVIKSKKEVLEVKSLLIDLLHNNSVFEQELINTANMYIDKKLAQGFHLNIPMREAIDASINYLIEELSVFSYLVSKKYSVQLYFGTQLPILKKLANGDLNINTDLKKGIYLDLSLKKIS